MFAWIELTKHWDVSRFSGCSSHFTRRLPEQQNSTAGFSLVLRQVQQVHKRSQPNARFADTVAGSRTGVALGTSDQAGCRAPSGVSYGLQFRRRIGLQTAPAGWRARCALYLEGGIQAQGHLKVTAYRGAWGDCENIHSGVIV